MKYDIQFIMPISSNNLRPEEWPNVGHQTDYKKRFLDFKKYGLLNIIKTKCCMTLLIHNSDEFTDEELYKDWPNNVDVEIVSCPSSHVVSKTYFYFSSYLKEIKDSKWIAKIDDDSTTDVDSLLQNLEQDFDYNKEYYIVTELKDDNNEIELQILRDMGYNRWTLGKVYHEWEMCIISAPAMNTILKNDNSINLMKHREAIHNGYNDCCLSIAARLAKVYPVEAYFLTQYASLNEYSILGGKFNHLHYISHDICPKKYDMLKSIANKSNKIDEFKNKKYLFTRDDVPICYLQLKENGTFHGAIHENETFWDYKNNKLTFYNQNCEPTTIFDIDKNFDKIKGRYLFDQNIIHKLIQIDIDF